MQFKALALATTALAGFVHAQEFSANVQFSAGTLASAIDAIADVSKQTNDIAVQINPFNPISLITAVPRVIINFKDITTTVASKILMLRGIRLDEPFPVNGQLQVCGAFRNFVKIHQALLNTIIGRSGFLVRTGFGGPLAGVLRLLEGGVDQLALLIIGFVPTCAAGAEQDRKALDQTFDLTLQRF
ncbi:hypothetical protein HYQ45_014197 [Verticillium longisporum]|uniref:Uncharacterized protein n=1 Tax=Verticillium longisporum TaxID=100787 RepID=A0A0G4M6I7_VERLO|nr:hypothetical protein HYQ44_014262 [Verticillium longisporum]KAG7122967.1 hypothetical protein HYQ45_014197 [Verticillium longisporum]KAG7145417.1 hypothetical protein HYQ46_005837 [Verticillium longisporum]CRK24407.1 hypothetical protein BN1723_013290 [Verticillium longisporum]CRK29884.1 hypothetical protein BN1708_015706 [Verticillium longisporum]